MIDFANLPSDITPQAFFDAVIEALKDEPAPAGAPDDKLVFHFVGEDGGSWAMGFEEGRLSIKAEEAEAPPMQITVSVEDFRAFAAGEIRDLIKEKAGEDAAAIDVKQISAFYGLSQKTEAVKGYSGDIQFIMEAPEKEYKATLTFGGGAPNTEAPTTTIRMALEDILAMADGELDPQTAFFTGKIRPDGDMNLAMSLFALLAN